MLLPHFRLMAWSISLAAQASATQKVVSMALNQKCNASAIYKRDPFAIYMQNFIPYGEYFVTASVGTPSQEIELIVDTGSSDIWFFGAGSCSSGPCEGGTFDPTKSNTLVEVPGGQGAFEIQYQTPGSGVRGNYIQDTFAVGGISLSNLTMAVATNAAQVPSGIMGIGLAVNEAGVGQGSPSYKNFPKELVAQGKIASTAYSLYLDDLSTSTGTIIFGGFDEAKFKGDLVMLPFQRDDQSHEFTSFTIAWTSLGLQTSTGDFALETNNFLYGAVLDTGTTLTYMPPALYSSLFKFFGAQNAQGITLVACDFGQKNPGQLIYGLGGVNGVQIIVDFDELAIPLYSTRTGKQLLLQNGQPACQFGISEATDGFSILFGQTFLRSAYVLYDLDNLAAGVAQTVFDSTESNVVAYNGQGTSDRIQTDVTGPTVTYAPTGTLQAPGGGYYSSTFVLSSFATTSAVVGGLTGQFSKVPTSYDVASFTYHSDKLPVAFPTAIAEGPTGLIPLSSGQASSVSSAAGSSSDQSSRASNGATMSRATTSTPRQSFYGSSTTTTTAASSGTSSGATTAAQSTTSNSYAFAGISLNHATILLTILPALFLL